MDPLIHLIYASAATTAFDDAELVALLDAARQKNGRLGITGMLLYSAGSFFQVLEGEPGAVEALYATIVADPRHTRTVAIIQERIARRSFGEWSMGFVTASPQELAALAGLNDFFAQASCFDQLDGGRVKKLLAAFRGGRWRAQLAGAPPVRATRRPRADA